MNGVVLGVVAIRNRGRSPNRKPSASIAAQIAAVFLDTLNRSLVGSESNDKDMAAYLEAADAIGEAFGCVVVIIHHCGVEGTRPRGHTFLSSACAAQLAVKRDKANVVVTVEYMMEKPEGHWITSRVEPVEVGIDEDSNAMRSLVVLPADNTAAAAAKTKTKASPLGRKFLGALRAAIREAKNHANARPPRRNHRTLAHPVREARPVRRAQPEGRQQSSPVLKVPA